MTGKSSRIYSFYFLCHYFNKNPIHIGLQDTFIVMVPGIVRRPLKEQNRCQVMQMLYKKESVSVGHDVSKCKEIIKVVARISNMFILLLTNTLVHRFAEIKEEF